MNFFETRYIKQQLRNKINTNNKTGDLLLAQLFVLMLLIIVAAILLQGRFNIFV